MRPRQLLTVASIGVVLAIACRSSPEPNLREALATEAEAVDAAVRAAVADGERAREAIVILELIRTEEAALLAGLTACREELEALNRDHDAPREAFSRVFEELRSERQAARARVLLQIVDLQELLTAEEWRSVHGKLVELDSVWQTLALR